MWAKACETATDMLNCTGKTCYWKVSNKDVEYSRNGFRSTTCVGHGLLCMFRKKFDNKSEFGRMTGYLNEYDGYQVYVQSFKKNVHSQDVYFKQE